MVIVHGYGASGIVFYKMFKELAQHFHLILVDMLGMGGSSRPEFKSKNANEAEEYFVESLEQWRVNMGNIKDFILVGHSFGGFIVGNYANRYPQYIIKLMLISPVGISKKKTGDLLSEKEKSNWKKNKSPFNFLRVAGTYLAKKLIKRYLKDRT